MYRIKNVKILIDYLIRHLRTQSI